MKAGRCILLLAGALLAGASSARGGEAIPLAARLEGLAQSYPAYIAGIEGNHLILRDGHRIVIDDGKEKTHEQKLDDADIEDMLSQVYPMGACYAGGQPAVNFDPGRIRNQAFFARLYGADVAAVGANLVAIDWFGQRLRVTRTAGVDRALVRVRDELAALGPGFQGILSPSAGTFVWRPIAGTKRLSPHSFGIAIDINTKYSDYWRWAGEKPGKVVSYKNRVPMEIVRVFERHGFIWGGKWYHYDTMHFEYRPELIRIGELAERAGC